MDIRVEYDGKCPNLCSGHLIVYIDNDVYDFGEYVLISGGCVRRDADWNMWTEKGEWSIDHFPDNFPEEYKEATIKAINEQIPHGCCGGCM